LPGILKNPGLLVSEAVSGIRQKVASTPRMINSEMTRTVTVTGFAIPNSAVDQDPH